jgi:hypothetical protein
MGKTVFVGEYNGNLAELLLGRKPCSVITLPRALHVVDYTGGNKFRFKGAVVRVRHRLLESFWESYFSSPHCSARDVFYAGLAVRATISSDGITVNGVVPFLAVACSHFEQVNYFGIKRLLELLDHMASVGFGAEKPYYYIVQKPQKKGGELIAEIRPEILALSDGCEEVAAIVYPEVYIPEKVHMRDALRLASRWLRQQLFSIKRFDPDAVARALEKPEQVVSALVR